MRREIKFRAWDIVSEYLVYSDEENAIFKCEEGEWDLKYIREKTIERDGIEHDVPVWHEADEIELMQYLGLKDKNGKEVYQGDIVNGEYTDDYGNNYDFINGIADYDISFGVVAENADFPLSVYDRLTVIGNIYENPELIKQESISA